MSDTLFVKNSTKILAAWLNDVNTNTYSAANKAALVLLTPALGLKVFVSSSDGGLFKAVVGAAATTYSDNGGAYCGTITIPTGGDGSIAWVRVDGGYNMGLGYNPDWFGTVEGVSDSSAGFNLALSLFKKISWSGNYKIDSALSIPDGSFFIADHPDSSSLDATGIVGAAIIVNGTVSPDDSFEDVWLHGFTLDGGATVANSGDHGVDIFKTTRTKVSWLKISNFGDNGLNYRGRNFHAEIDTVDCAGNFGYNASVDWDGVSRNNGFVWTNFRTYGSTRGSAGNNLYLNQCNTHKFINCNIEDVNCTGYQILMGDNVHNIDFDTLYSENNTRVGNHIYIDGTSSVCSGIKFRNSNISSNADTAKTTLIAINNALDTEIDGGRLQLFQSSGTYAHEAISTTASTGSVHEHTTFDASHANSVFRNVNAANIAADTYKINEGRRIQAIFYANNLAASQTDTQLTLNAGTLQEWPMVFAGTVIGLRVRLSEVAAGSTITIDVRANGSKLSACQATVTAGSFTGTFANLIDTTNATFAAGDRLDIVFTTDGSWTATTSDMQCSLIVES